MVTLDNYLLHGEISFNGELLLCDHLGALYWPAQNCLIVSDLHLEKGAAMAVRGFMIPPYDSNTTFARLEECLSRWKPEAVICLGDSFHREDSADNLERQLHDKITGLTHAYQWVWITGNHDPEIPGHLGGRSVDEIHVGPVVFRHEQRELGRAGEISGHLHPAASISRHGKIIRRRCFVSDGKRLIMPAFGAYTGGLDLKHEAFAKLLNNSKLQIWMLGAERVYEICAKKAGYNISSKTTV